MNDVLAPAGGLDHSLDGLLMGDASQAGISPQTYYFCGGVYVLKDTGVRQAVVQNEVRAAQAFGPPKGKQPEIAGSGPDQVDSPGTAGRVLHHGKLVVGRLEKVAKWDRGTTLCCKIKLIE
jgi:hypothetical protein